jgi:hypothetical protein
MSEFLSQLNIARNVIPRLVANFGANQRRQRDDNQPKSARRDSR